MNKKCTLNDMAGFDGSKTLISNFFDRWALEWVFIGRFYRNNYRENPVAPSDEKLVAAIFEKSEEISRLIKQGFGRFGKPKIENVDTKTIIGLTADIMHLDSQLGHKPDDSKRIKRLVGITIRIISGDTAGLIEDSEGNYPDWYRDLR